MDRAALSKDKFNNSLVAGGYYALGLDYGVISPDELEGIKGRLESAQGNVEKLGFYSDETGGEILNGLVKNYFAQVDGNDALLAKQYGIRSTRLLSFGMTGASPRVSTMYSQPVDVKLDSIYVDIDNDASSVVSENNDVNKAKAYVMHSGIIGSALEHSVIEQASGVKSVSTIKIFQLAQERGIPLYNIDKNNIKEVLPKLSVSDSIKTEITNSINSGKTVTIPETELSYYDWQGTGYIVQDPDTGSAGYMISGGHAGGSGASKFDNLDWNEIFNSFAKGLIDGIKVGMGFALIKIGLLCIFAPELVVAIMSILAVVFTILLIADVIDLMEKYVTDQVNLQEYYMKLAYDIGMMFGAAISGVDDPSVKISESAEIKLINNKYSIGEKVGDAIYEKGGAKNYESLAKEGNRLSKSGLSEEQICDSIKEVPTEKIPKFTEAVEKYKSENPGKELTDYQLNLIKKSVNEGKTTEEIMKILDGAGETITSENVSNLPENVENSFNQYNKSGWKGNVPGQSAGTKAGGSYQNSNGALPTTDAAGKPITYQEFDVNNKLPNASRDAQRFVKGSDGSVYYTDSHYGDIKSPTGLPSFVKIK
jgi:hypothetical protein